MDARRTKAWRASRITRSGGTPTSLHQLAVDHSERHSALLGAVRRSGWFDVQMDRLATKAARIRELVGDPSPGGCVHQLAPEERTRS